MKKRLIFLILLQLFSLKIYGQWSLWDAGGVPWATATSTKVTITVDTLAATNFVVTTVSLTELSAGSGIYADADGDSIIVNPAGFSITNSAAAGNIAWQYKDGSYNFTNIDTTGIFTVGHGNEDNYTPSIKLLYDSDSDVGTIKADSLLISIAPNASSSGQVVFNATGASSYKIESSGSYLTINGSRIGYTVGLYRASIEYSNSINIETGSGPGYGVNLDVQDAAGADNEIRIGDTGNVGEYAVVDSLGSIYASSSGGFVMSTSAPTVLKKGNFYFQGDNTSPDTLWIYNGAAWIADVISF